MTLTRNPPRKLTDEKKIWLFDPSMLSSDNFSPLEHNAPKVDNDFFEAALRPGGPVPLRSKAALGLIAQYIAVGMIYGMIPSLVYPVYYQYLNFNGYEGASYSVLVTICWSIKVCMGIISDCFPIFGYKRKPYMVIGWSVAMIASLVMAIYPFPEPYLGSELASYPPSVIRQVRAGNFSALNATDRQYVHPDRVQAASLWIFLSLIASFGYLLADVAADALVVQYSQREPLYIRGRIQSITFGCRFAANMIPNAVLGFCMNSFSYGGSYSWSISPNVVYGLLVVPCFMAILAAIFWIEDEMGLKVQFKQYMKQLWGLMKLRVMWQICAFRFCSNLFFYFDSTVGLPISLTWAGVQPVTFSWYTVLSTLIMTCTIFSCGKWGLHWNWRVAIAIATVLAAILDTTIMLCTTWDVFRDQYVFVGGLLSSILPTSIRWIIAAYCAVEIADVGNEGAVNALVTSISNLAEPFATFLYKYVNSYFEAIEDLSADSTTTRIQVTYVLSISFGMKLLSLIWLVLLPSQKAAVQFLKRKGGSNSLAAIVLVVVYLIALSFSVTTNIMSLYPSTSCYRIAGGNGKTVVKDNQIICG